MIPSNQPIAKHVDQLKQRWQRGELTTREYHDSIERAKRTLSMEDFFRL